MLITSATVGRLPQPFLIQFAEVERYLNFFKAVEAVPKQEAVAVRSGREPHFENPSSAIESHGQRHSPPAIEITDEPHLLVRSRRELEERRAGIRIKRVHSPIQKDPNVVEW